MLGQMKWIKMNKMFYGIDRAQSSQELSAIVLLRKVGNKLEIYDCETFSSSDYIQQEEQMRDILNKWKNLYKLDIISLDDIRFEIKQVPPKLQF